VVRNSQVDIVFGSVGGAEVVVCIGVARVDFDCLAIIFSRPVDVVGAISDAAIVIVIGVVRVDFDRLGEVCDAAWSPLALNELCGRSTHSHRPGWFRSLTEICDGAVVVAFEAVG
jgi:hypothetical protein